MTLSALMLATLLIGDTDNPRPEIFLRYSGRSAPIDTSKVRMWVDGVEVTAQATVTASRVSYTPKKDLALGVHRVLVEVVDTRDRKKTKSWSFRIGTSKRDRIAPAMAFGGATPKNGGVLAASDLPARVEIDLSDSGGSGIDPASVRISVARNGGGFRDATAQAKITEQSIRLTLPRTLSGTCMVRVFCRDRAGNRAADLYRGFSVDAVPPTLTSLEAVPTEPAVGATVQIIASVSDSPLEEVRELEIEVRSKGRLVETLRGRPVAGKSRFTWSPKEAGTYELSYRIVDWAGNTTSGRSPGRIRVSNAAPLDLRLNNPNSSATQSSIEISGQTSAGAEVEIWVNGRSVDRLFAGGSGLFAAKSVPLEPGRNRIEALARDLASGSESPRRTVSTTLATTTPARPSPANPPSAPVITRPRNRSTFSAGGRKLIDVGGTSAPRVRITIFLDGVQVGQTTSNAAGRFNVPRIALSKETHTLTARARDAVGRTSSPSSAVTVTRKKK